MMSRISKIEKGALKMSDIEAMLLDKDSNFEIYDLESKQKRKHLQMDKRYDSRVSASNSKAKLVPNKNSARLSTTLRTSNLTGLSQIKA